MTAEKVLAIYAFRAIKSPVFQGFSGMVGGVVGLIYDIPSETLF